jgi:hypothetical protein
MCDGGILMVDVDADLGRDDASGVGVLGLRVVSGRRSEVIGGRISTRLPARREAASEMNFHAVQ